MIDVKRCPSKLLKADDVAVLREFPHTKNGVWPCAGGTQDQSATYRDCVDIIAVEVARLEAESIKEP